MVFDGIFYHFLGSEVLKIRSMECVQCLHHVTGVFMVLLLLLRKYTPNQMEFTLETWIQLSRICLS